MHSRATKAGHICEQECISVGCVPSAAAAISRAGGLLLGGSAPGDLLGGVSGPRGSGPRRGSTPGWCLLPVGGGIPACTEADTTPLWTE